MIWMQHSPFRRSWVKSCFWQSDVTTPWRNIGYPTKGKPRTGWRHAFHGWRRLDAQFTRFFLEVQFSRIAWSRSDISVTRKFCSSVIDAVNSFNFQKLWLVDTRFSIHSEAPRLARYTKHTIPLYARMRFMPSGCFGLSFNDYNPI